MANLLRSLGVFMLMTACEAQRNPFDITKPVFNDVNVNYKDNQSGEIKAGKIKLKCVEVSHDDCVGCILAQTSPCNEFVGGCAPYERSDKKNVIFIEAKEENNG